MKTLKNNWRTMLATAVGGLLAITTLTVWSQSLPTLTITPLGTNQYSISFTNNIGADSYDLQWTPVLADANYPWTWVAIGTPGQTNYLVTSPYPTAFFRTILDTNSIPLWQAADPNNPALGALSITIDTPTNGSTLQ